MVARPSRQNVLTCFPLPKQTYAYLGYLLDWLVVVMPFVLIPKVVKTNPLHVPAR